MVLFCLSLGCEQIQIIKSTWVKRIFMRLARQVRLLEINGQNYHLMLANSLLILLISASLLLQFRMSEMKTA